MLRSLHIKVIGRKYITGLYFDGCNLSSSAISASTRLCHSKMKAPSVLQSKNRAEKALFVGFFPLNRQDNPTKWTTVVPLCMRYPKTLCCPTKHYF